MTLVADTGPLIGLAKLGKLALLQTLARQVLIPPVVYRELLGKVGEEAKDIDQALRDFLHVTELPPLASQVEEAVAHLDQGEQQAIALAYHMDALLLIDDRAGRQTAQRLGIRTTGLVGFLLRLKETGKVEHVTPLLSALRQQGYWLSDEIVAFARRLAGEA